MIASSFAETRWDTSISTNKQTDQPFLDYFVRKLGIVYGSMAMDDSIFVRGDKMGHVNPCYSYISVAEHVA